MGLRMKNLNIFCGLLKNRTFRGEGGGGEVHEKTNIERGIA